MAQTNTSARRKPIPPAIGGRVFESDARESTELAPETLIPSPDRTQAHELPNEAQDREGRIAERAYWHAAQRGFEPGHELEDWLQAEKEIDAEQVEQATPDDQFTG